MKKLLFTILLLITTQLTFAVDPEEIANTWAMSYDSQDTIRDMQGRIDVYPLADRVSINYIELTSLGRVDITYSEIRQQIMNNDEYCNAVTKRMASQHSDFEQRMSDLVIVTKDISGGRSVEHTRTFSLILDRTNLEIIGYSLYNDYIKQKYPVASCFMPKSWKESGHIFSLERGMERRN